MPRRVASAAPAVLPGRLGLLLPRSEAGDAFLRGLRLALPDQPIAAERVEMGRAAAAEGARRLMAASGGRLIGLMGPNLAAAAASELKSSGATLLAVDTGANVIRADEESPQVITHSLGLWRSSVALGTWTARQYGPRGLVMSGIVESGYDMLHAFEIGVTAAGGEALPAIVTHASPVPVDWTAVLKQVKAARPDVVYALYSGTAAVEFLQAWRSAGLRIPLVASPFLVDERLLPQHHGRAAGIVSAASWTPALANPVNERFVSAYTAAAGSAPDAFALLGYEAGILAAAGQNGADGPRGWIRPGPLGATRFPLRSAVRTGWTPPYLV